MKMKDFKKALLVAILISQRKKGLNSYISPRQAAESFGLAYESGQIRLAVTEFKDRGLIRAAFTMGGGGQDNGLDCSLTASGVEEAEELEDSVLELMNTPRFLEIVSDKKGIEPLREKVSELRELVADNRDNDFVDKNGRLAEIMALELLLSQPQISVPLVEKILRETVTFLAHKFADKAIGIAAGAILGLAATTFGFGIPH